MRISLCNEVIRDLPFAAQCELTARLGYDGLEVAPFTLDAKAPHRISAARRAEFRRAATDAGLPITSLHWLLVAPPGISITSGDPSVRARTLDVVERLIGLAADLGATLLVHGSPQQRRVEAPGDAERAEETMAKAGEWAAAAGLVYCLEPLDRAQTNWCTTVAEAAAIVNRIGNPALRTMIDHCAAANGEEESVPALIERWMPSGTVAHIHLNDRNRRAPGQGNDRFWPVFAALQRTGYSGICAVEPFEYLPDGPTSAARAIGYLRGCMEGRA